MRYFCPSCNNEMDFVVEKQVFANGTEHLRGTCTTCHHTKFLPQNKPADQVILPFGKHKGKRLIDVPADYLEWLIEKSVVKGGLLNSCKELIQQRHCEFCKSFNVSVIDDDGSALLACMNCGAKVVHRD